VPWADGSSRFTETFNNEVAWMALQMSKLAVSTLMGINWRTVGNCIKAAHDRIEPDVSARLRGLRRICVDETSYRKGHSYIELAQHRCEAEKELAAMPKRGRPSKRRKELEAFLREQAVLTALTDMQPTSPGRPPKERFSSEHQEILDVLSQRAKDIKGSRYALGHNPENRTESQTEKLRLIENSYPDLYKAYQLKETLRLILHLKDCDLAAEELDKWLADTASCELKSMVELAEKIQRHRDNILNSIRFQANSAKSEATNTTVKALIKMARGFRNLENMKALIYLKCSDLLIPLNNRPQPSAEKRRAMRLEAAQRRKSRQEAARQPEITA
jgi:transposase